MTAVQTAPIRVLVVDDETAIVELVRGYLDCEARRRPAWPAGGVWKWLWA